MTTDRALEVESYCLLIDEFVEIAKSDPAAAKIRLHGHSERTNTESNPLDANEEARRGLLVSLEPAQRELVAQMLEEARSRAVHDLLARLEWKSTSDDFKMVWKDITIPLSPFASMHYDFACRFDGYPWPDDADDGG